MRVSMEGFSQAAAVSLGLDITDLTILRWIVDFQATLHVDIINEEDGAYFWISYGKMMEDMPILNIKKRALLYRLDKLIEAKILEKKVVRNQGSFSYFKFGQNFGKLIALYSDGYATDCTQTEEDGESNIAEGAENEAGNADDRAMDCTGVRKKLHEPRKKLHSDRAKNCTNRAKNCTPNINNIYINIISDYNTICSQLPRCKKLTDKRRRMIAALLEKGETRESFQAAFRKANDTPFLIGQNGRGWKADFDFFMREDKLVKILEGGYDHLIFEEPGTREPERTSQYEEW